MTRSERLAIENKVEVYIGSYEIATVIPHCSAVENLRYIGTDCSCLYDGVEVEADIYEERITNRLYAVIFD